MLRIYTDLASARVSLSVIIFTFITIFQSKPGQAQSFVPCPVDTFFINCNELPPDFDPFNTWQLQELFGTFGSEFAPSPLLDECGAGDITRRFSRTDEPSCVQIVRIEKNHDYSIKFPKDAIITCGEVSSDTLAYSTSGCDMISVSISEDFAVPNGMVCMEFMRTYSVINWCEYNGFSNPVVIARDEDCNGIEGDLDVYVHVTGDDQTYIDQDEDPFNQVPAAETKTLVCDDTTNPTGYWKNDTMDPAIHSVGYWQYSQRVQIIDNTPPSLILPENNQFCSINNDSCTAFVNLPLIVEESCATSITFNALLDLHNDNEEVINLPEGTIEGVFPNFFFRGDYPIGTHKILIDLTDGCDNTTSIPVQVFFEVTDCAVAPVTCIEGVGGDLGPINPPIDLGGNGIAEFDYGVILEPSNFINDRETDCSGELIHAIYLEADFEANPDLVPDPNHNQVFVDCDPFPSEIDVRIYSFDPVGNFDYCPSTFFVFNSTCTPNSTLIGQINTPDGIPIEGVAVSLSNNAQNMEFTDENGFYSFENLNQVSDVTVTPALDDNHLVGVSTFDLVLIGRHILNTQVITDPYAIIAADINNSGTVSSLDLISGRRAILSLTTDFPGNTSWKFIPEDFEFTDPLNPFMDFIPSQININNLDDQADANFIGIKVGDVDGNALANLQDLEERNRRAPYQIQLQNKTFQVGELVEIPVLSNPAQPVQGFQFTLEFDPAKLALTNIEHALLEEKHIGMSAKDEGYITVSWNGDPIKETTLFTLQFEALQTGQIEDAFQITSSKTVAEAYNLKDQTLTIGLGFINQNTPNSNFEVFQNQPNPFESTTFIPFYVSKQRTIELQVFDTNGKQWKTVQQTVDAGFQQIKLDLSDLPTGGIYYYSLKTGNEKVTRKMVLIR